MNQEEIKTYNILKQLLSGAKDYSMTDPHQALGDAETIIACLATLTDPLMRLEQTYRQKMVEYIDQDQSKAEAETRAKAGDEYRQWKKLQTMYELGNQQVLLLKKFKDILEQEYVRS